MVGLLGLAISGGAGRAWAADGTNAPAKDKEAKAEKLAKASESARAILPEDVQKKILQLKSQRDTYQVEQKQLMKQWKDASQEERDNLREELKKNRQEFLADQRAMRQEIRTRLDELRQEFRNSRDQMLDDAKEKTRDGKRGRDGD